MLMSVSCNVFKNGLEGIEDKVMYLGSRSNKWSHKSSIESQLAEFDDEMLIEALPWYGCCSKRLLVHIHASECGRGVVRCCCTTTAIAFCRGVEQV